MNNVFLIQKDDLREIFLEVINEQGRNEKKESPLLLKEYAEQNKICYQTAYRHATNGVINAKKLGGKWYVMQTN